MVTLRPYQDEALAATMAALERGPRALIQAATGAGKTILFAELIRRWSLAWPELSIGVLAHRRELVAQARDKLLKVWPEGISRLGVACAGLGKVETGRQVVIGSIQTLGRRAMAKPINLLIIDEAHRVPPLGGPPSAYSQLLERLTAAYPALRVLGVTATPYRLGHGYIYGGEHKPGRQNLWPELTYQIGLNQLIQAGHLAPIRAKEAVDPGADLAAVGLTHGDYRPDQLSALMTRTVHIQSAVQAYETHGEGRQHVLVFAVSIDHAERLAEAFSVAGHPAAAVHSKMDLVDRDRILRRFEAGALQVLVNVGILTEGWDSPLVDLIMLCRPTKAPALFVQMVGRGTRPAPGKENLLVLDLSGAWREHGDPDDPLIRWGQSQGGEAPVKVCKTCLTMVPASTRICPECGFKWPAPEVVLSTEAPAMREITPPPPGHSRVVSWSLEQYLTRRGHDMLCLTLNLRPGGAVKHYWDIEGRASSYSRGKAWAWWWKVSGGQGAPATIGEALARQAEIKIPEHVEIVIDGAYKKIKGW